MIKPWMRIYTDGSCSQAGAATGPGGWAWVAEEYDDEFGPREHERSGGKAETTNQRMELTAVLEALKYAMDFGPKLVTIYSDSAYVVNCFRDRWHLAWESNGWKNSAGKPVANRDLWEDVLQWKQDLEEFGARGGTTVKFEKVKGHADDELNIKADALAVAAREALMDGSDDDV